MWFSFGEMNIFGIRKGDFCAGLSYVTELTFEIRYQKRYPAVVIQCVVIPDYNVLCLRLIANTPFLVLFGLKSPKNLTLFKKIYI